jgi:hypothetical protein
MVKLALRIVVVSVTKTAAARIGLSAAVLRAGKR